MIETVISWDGNYFSPDYEADFVQGTQPRLPASSVAALERSGAWPIVTALQRKKNQLFLIIKILDYTNLDALRAQLFRWFDPDDETPKPLVVENGGGIPQYVYALCDELRLYSDPRHQEVFVATLTVDGDPLWRAAAEAPDVWDITATGETHTIVNTSEADAYPILDIEPTSAKASGWTYRRWIPIIWNVATACANYTLEITSTEGTGFDHAALVGAGKALASGDDLRVEVDGLQVDRWIDGPDTASCKVWANFNFAPAQSAVLLDIVGTIIIASSDISGFPASGILLIDSEAFTYTSKNNTTREFFGVTDEAKGTSSAGHTPGTAIYWIQHDVWLLYGNAAVGAPVVNGDMEPAFDLTLSTNWEWDYKDFAAGFTPSDLNSFPQYWSQRWVPEQLRWAFHPYGGDEDSFPSLVKYCPWEVLGLRTNVYVYGTDVHDRWVGCDGRFYLHNPCGILEANFIDGKKCKGHTSGNWTGEIQSSADGAAWGKEYEIPSPVVSGYGVWEAWNQDETLVAGATYVALYVRGGWWDGTSGWSNFLQADECVVTLDDANTPTITLGNEQATYSLACRITNNDTGEAIDVTMTMDLNEALEVDTDAKNVVYLHDNGVQLQALTFVGGVRRNWLRLAPGANELQFDDPDTVAVTITTTWQRRYY